MKVRGSFLLSAKKANDAQGGKKQDTPLHLSASPTPAQARPSNTVQDSTPAATEEATATIAADSCRIELPRLRREETSRHNQAARTSATGVLCNAREEGPSSVPFAGRRSRSLVSGESHMRNVRAGSLSLYVFFSLQKKKNGKGRGVERSGSQILCWVAKDWLPPPLPLFRLLFLSTRKEDTQTTTKCFLITAMSR